MSEIDNKHLTVSELWKIIDNPLLTDANREHLATCAQCNQLMTELKSIDAELNMLSPEDPSMAFSRNVIRRWESSKISYPWFVATLIVSFMMVFGISIYYAIANGHAYNSSIIQVFSLVVVVCIFRMVDIWPNKKRSKA